MGNVTLPLSRGELDCHRLAAFGYVMRRYIRNDGSQLSIMAWISSLKRSARGGQDGISLA